MTLRAPAWSWRYTMQYTAGRTVPPRLPETKHAVPTGTETSLCNRVPYWRLAPDYRRWFGAIDDEAELMAGMKPCQACTGKIAVLEGAAK
jgi:hypothetical protein